MSMSSPYSTSKGLKKQGRVGVRMNDSAVNDDKFPKNTEISISFRVMLLSYMLYVQKKMRMWHLED